MGSEDRKNIAERTRRQHGWTSAFIPATPNTTGTHHRLRGQKHCHKLWTTSETPLFYFLLVSLLAYAVNVHGVTFRARVVADGPLECCGGNAVADIAAPVPLRETWFELRASGPEHSLPLDSAKHRSGRVFQYDRTGPRGRRQRRCRGLILVPSSAATDILRSGWPLPLVAIAMQLPTSVPGLRSAEERGSSLVAVGSAQNVTLPLAVLNTAVTEGMWKLASLIDAGPTPRRRCGVDVDGELWCHLQRRRVFSGVAGPSGQAGCPLVCRRRLSRRACSASWFDGALFVTNIRSRSVCKGSWNQCATSCGTQRFCVPTCVMSSEIRVVDAQECACAEKAACQTRLPQACAVCPPSAPSLHGCHLQKAEMARQIHLP